MRKKSSLNFVDRLQLGVDTRLKIYDMLNSYMSAGIGLKQALIKMQETEKIRKGSKSALYKVYGVMLRRLGSGRGKLGDMFEGIAPMAERMVLNAGAAHIRNSFQSAIDVAIVTRKMNQGFYGAQIYPAILFLVSYIMFLLYIVKILPDLLLSLPEGAEYSKMTNFAISLNHTVIYWVPATIIFIVGMILLIALSLPNWKGKWRTKLEKFPPYNMYRLKEGCSWLIAVGSLTHSGIKLDAALTQLMKFAKPYLRHRISSTIYYLKRGSNIGTALTKTKLDFPDPDMVDRIGVYAQTPDFSDKIDSLAKEFAERGIEKINKQSAVIRTFGLAVIGFVVLMIIGINFSITSDLSNSQQNYSSSR
ncbi:MAG: hypothetical protein EKK54_06070 [Neisseriaceae bacterium]|nr:MAG: hypothetical protein EKK54_06070 [Neisseriaceae bacterium]